MRTATMSGRGAAMMMKTARLDPKEIMIVPDGLGGKTSLTIPGVDERSKPKTKMMDTKTVQPGVVVQETETLKR